MPYDPVNELQRVIGHGGVELFERAPRLLEQILIDRIWEQKLDKEGHPFRSFEVFVTYPLWQGLESTIEDLMLICRRRSDVQVLIRGEIEPLASHGGRHGNQYIKNEEWQADNISLPHEQNGNRLEKPQHGTSPVYTLQRLKRDRPDIAGRVVSGEISAHAGAVEAGFRKRQTPFEQIVRLLPKLSEEERAKVHEITAPDIQELHDEISKHAIH